LQQLFSTKERMMILGHVLSGGSLNTNTISMKTGVSKGLVSIYLTMLVSFGMLGKSGRKYVPKREELIFRAVKTLFNTVRLGNVKPFDRKITGIGVYGSYAKGTNTPESDIDIWIKASDRLGEEKVARFEYEMANAMGSKVNAIVIDPERMERLKKEDKEFYHSIAAGSITLWGESLGD